MNYIWVAIGGAIGTTGRYWLSGLVARLIGETFPWGTLLINVTGSLVIGFFATLTGPDGRLLVGSTARQFVMVGDGELREAIDLVAPQVDTGRHVSRGGEDVDDTAAHGELTPVFDLMLAPVALGDQLGQQCLGVDLLPRTDHDWGESLQRAQPLEQGTNRCDDHPGWCRQ